MTVTIHRGNHGRIRVSIARIVLDAKRFEGEQSSDNPLCTWDELDARARLQLRFLVMRHLRQTAEIRRRDGDQFDFVHGVAIRVRLGDQMLRASTYVGDESPLTWEEVEGQAFAKLEPEIDRLLGFT